MCSWRAFQRFNDGLFLFDAARAQHQWRRSSVGNLSCIFELFKPQTDLKCAQIQLPWSQTWAMLTLTILKLLNTFLTSVKEVGAESFEVSFNLFLFVNSKIKYPGFFLLTDRKHAIAPYRKRLTLGSESKMEQSSTSWNWCMKTMTSILKNGGWAGSRGGVY